MNRKNSLGFTLLELMIVMTIMLILMAVGVSLVEVSRRVERYLLRWRPPQAQMG